MNSDFSGFFTSGLAAIYTQIPRRMPFRLLDLPPEVRLQILGDMLCHSTPIYTTSAHILTPPRPTSLGISPLILCTCKQLYEEGLPFLYSRNTFQAHPTLLKQSVFALEPSRRVIALRCLKLITRWHVRVRLDCDPFYSPADVVEAFSGCKMVEVEVFRSSWGAGGYSALYGFSKVRGVKSARIHGSIESTIARDLKEMMESEKGGMSAEWVENESWVVKYDRRY